MPWPRCRMGGSTSRWPRWSSWQRSDSRRGMSGSPSSSNGLELAAWPTMPRSCPCMIHTEDLRCILMDLRPRSAPRETTRSIKHNYSNNNSSSTRQCLASSLRQIFDRLPASVEHTTDPSSPLLFHNTSTPPCLLLGRLSVPLYLLSVLRQSEHRRKPQKPKPKLCKPSFSWVPLTLPWALTLQEQAPPRPTTPAKDRCLPIEPNFLHHPGTLPLQEVRAPAQRAVELTLPAPRRLLYRKVEADWWSNRCTNDDSIHSFHTSICYRSSLTKLTTLLACLIHHLDEHGFGIGNG